MKAADFPQRRLLVGIIITAGVFAVLLFSSDREELLRILQYADWRSLAPALLFTAVSYLCVGYSFAWISRTIGIRMDTRPLTEVGFISVILNHIFSTGGIAGYSVRYLLMRSYGVGLKEVAAASVLHFYITSLDMLSMLPVGFLYVLINGRVSQPVANVLGIMTAGMTVVAIIATLLVFVNRWREPFITRVGRIITAALHRDVETALDQFDEVLARSVRQLRADPKRLVGIMIITFIDWWASVAVLYFCFLALGPAQNLMVVMSGFVIGVMAGVLSMAPGGLGVQEGSMAGVFALLGVSFEQAVLASILFRIVYYLLPYVFSLGFYGHLLQRSKMQVNGGN